MVWSTRALTLIGLAPIDWLGDPQWTKSTLVVMNLWAFGGLMLIDLAAIQQVPRDLLDAARSGWRDELGTLASCDSAGDCARLVFQHCRQRYRDAANFYARVYLYVKYSGYGGAG